MQNGRSDLRVLITGGTGLLGVALQLTAPAGVVVTGIHHPVRPLVVPLPFPNIGGDITDPVALDSIFQDVRPTVVIHAAAIGSVDFAQQNQSVARLVNVQGTEHVARLCERHRARLIYVSSNAVFNGRNPPYSEESPLSPINYYGELKVEAETVVREADVSSTIIRPILMYGWPYPDERQNPVSWWIQRLAAKKPIKVVDNVYSKPLPAWSCAAAVWSLIGRNLPGTFHVAGKDHVSLYDFARITAQVFELDQHLIEPVPDSYFPEIAPRPPDTSFDTTRLEREIGFSPVGVSEGLRLMRQQGPYKT